MNLISEKVSLAEAAAFLECPLEVLIRMLDEGQLAGFKVDTTWVIPRGAFITAVNEFASASASARRRGLRSSHPHGQESPVAPLYGLKSALTIAGGGRTKSVERSVVQEYVLHRYRIQIVRRRGRKPPFYFALVADPHADAWHETPVGFSASIDEAKNAAAVWVRDQRRMRPF